MTTPLSATDLKIHNFSAGPAILPQEVLAEASNAVRDFAGRGLSLLEVSHRSKEFVAVMDEARHLAKELLGFGNDHEAIFLGGGASSQFYMVPFNLMPEHGTASYLDTGTWSAKAIKEGKKFGQVHLAASSADRKYTYIPKQLDVAANSAYLHLQSNNTIFGTQLKAFPTSDVPLVCDMSSDIFSRPIPADDFGIVYAGAQKNMGPAGVTLVIVRKDLLGKVNRDIPTLIDYRTQIEKGSMFNTPPVFPVYVSMLTMRWVKANGGVAGMAERNAQKAERLYAEIDRNPLFLGTTAVEDRSTMNATFRTAEGVDEASFLSLCTARKLDALKGHRSVGGFRASMYNAMGLDSIDALVQTMQDFEQQA